MPQKEIPTHKRALMLQACMEKNLSGNTHNRLCKIIKNIRETQGHEAAEQKAEELTELINNSKTEAEIIKAIDAMLLQQVKAKIKVSS